MTRAVRLISEWTWQLVLTRVKFYHCWMRWRWGEWGGGFKRLFKSGCTRPWKAWLQNHFDWDVTLHAFVDGLLYSILYSFSSRGPSYFRPPSPTPSPFLSQGVGIQPLRWSHWIVLIINVMCYHITLKCWDVRKLIVSWQCYQIMVFGCWLWGWLFYLFPIYLKNL